MSAVHDRVGFGGAAAHERHTDALSPCLGCRVPKGQDMEPWRSDAKTKTGTESEAKAHAETDRETETQRDTEAATETEIGPPWRDLYLLREGHEAKGNGSQIRVFKRSRIPGEGGGHE